MDERRSHETFDVRLSVTENEMRNLGRRLDDHVRNSEQLHREQISLIRKLDERADRQDVNMARLLAALSVVIVAGQIIAPVILRFVLGVGS